MAKVQNFKLDAYWSQPLDTLMAHLNSRSAGLNTAEARRQLQRFGPNTFKPGQPHPVPTLLLKQFSSPLVLILVFAVIVSAFVQAWTDAVIVLGIVLGSSLLGFWQEYSATNAITQLQARLTLTTNALRDGRPQTIPADTVVPGDIVLLVAGSLIPADGVLLEAKDFFVSQAVLTGETFPVEKKVAEQPDEVAATASLVERTN